MNSKPNLVHQFGARSHAGCMMLFFAAVWAAAIAFAFVPGLPGWWVVCWIAAATLTMGFLAGKHLPLLIRGGTYRLVIQDGWLRAESPHQLLGRNFAVALSTITKLVVRPYNDGLDSYEVHTSSGETFPLEAGLGPWVFKVIQQLHPEIPVERRGCGDEAARVKKDRDSCPSVDRRGR
jgi:hypothetical protein